MTSPAIARDPIADHMLTPENAALIIIDFQPVQVGSIVTMNKRLLVKNVTALARTAKLYGLPVVLDRQCRDRAEHADDPSDHRGAARCAAHRSQLDQRLGGR